MALGLDRLQDELRVVGARWNAGPNPVWDLAPEERRWLRPCAAGLGKSELEQRVRAARRARALRGGGPGAALAASGLCARLKDGVGEVRASLEATDCAAASFVAEVTLHLAARSAAFEEAARLTASRLPLLCPYRSSREALAGDSGCDWRELDDSDAMKEWLLTRGPLLSLFAVHEDFYAYLDGVYHYVSGACEGGHCVAVIGFDDGGEYWVARNSWGSLWGEGGTFRIGFGERGIDASMWGVELGGGSP